MIVKRELPGFGCAGSAVVGITAGNVDGQALHHWQVMKKRNIRLACYFPDIDKGRRKRRRGCLIVESSTGGARRERREAHTGCRDGGIKIALNGKTLPAIFPRKT